MDVLTTTELYTLKGEFYGMQVMSQLKKDFLAQCDMWWLRVGHVLATLAPQPRAFLNISAQFPHIFSFLSDSCPHSFRTVILSLGLGGGM